MLRPTAATGAAQSIRSTHHGALFSHRLPLLIAGVLLATVSLALAGHAGWARGATLVESAIWSTAGVALAIVSLVGLSVALNSAHRAMALVAWLLAITVTIVVALGSQHSGREHAASHANANSGDRARHEAAYKQAAAALAAIPATRPAAVIEAELAAVLNDERLQDCSGWLASKRLRTTCIEQVEPARAELANAQAHADLTARMDAATAALATPLASPANGDAAALARYLAAVGITASTDRLADLISLVQVLALEVVGAFALALSRAPVPVVRQSRDHEARAESVAPQAATISDSSGGEGGVSDVPQSPAPIPPQPNNHGPESEPHHRKESNAATIARLKRNIEESLTVGALDTSHRRLAESLGVGHGSVARAISELEAAGRVRVAATRRGTRLERIAA